MRFISRHITILVINSFGRGHTHTHTYEHTYRQFTQDQILRNQACASLGRHAPGLKRGKQVWDQNSSYGNKLKMELKGCYRMNVNSKAFAIPILIVRICFSSWHDISRNKDSKCFSIKFHSIATLELHLQLVFILFWSLTSLDGFSFDPYFFLKFLKLYTYYITNVKHHLFLYC